MNILVTGGTGHLGRDFVRAAMVAGHGVRIASRRPRPADAPDELEWATLDLSTGEGLRESLAGMDAVIHAASDPKDTIAVDVEGTRRLAETARDAGVGHLQSVATEDVADRLLRAITEGPRSLLRDFAGPEPMTLADAAAAWKAARGIRKPTIPIPVPGRLGAAFRAGYNTAPDGERGVLGWWQWLEQSVSSVGGRLMSIRTAGGTAMRQP
jgi:uncharacterized protein YbjT (DUF2867 family)